MLNTPSLDGKHQSSYKVGYLTETSLLSIENDMCLVLSEEEATAVVLHDLSSVLDTITLRLIGYHHGLVYICESAITSCTFLITFNAFKKGSVLSNAQKLRYRLWFLNLNYFHFIPFFLPMLLPSTPISVFILMLMIPNFL